MPDADDEISLTLQRLGLAEYESIVRTSPDPKLAATNLERWLSAAKGMALALDDDPAFRARLLFVFGASQAVADILLQNPELAMILADQHELGLPVKAVETSRRGRELLKDSTSFTHRLDRLRYLKQRTLLQIIWNDLSGIWEPEYVWEAISALADVILQLASEIVWKEMEPSDDLPVAIVAMGKHGSAELNYSSDIDLMFVCDDDYQDMDKAAKFCERFTRAIEGKMGRGSLYRIDLRLRPLGKAGPIVQRLSSAVSYYANYCEPWEVMALIRSRPCAGSASVGEKFQDAITPIVYKGARSELFIEQLANAKRRYEEHIRKRGGSVRNLKLGVGGIRDIEFLVQLMQLLYGNKVSSLRGVATTKAIKHLAELDHLAPNEADTLSSAYTLFRQVEHRIQIRYDLQSHDLPENADDCEILARLIGATDCETLRAELSRKRRDVREILLERVPVLRQPFRSSLDVEKLFMVPGDSAPGLAAARLVEFSEHSEVFAKQLQSDPAARERVMLIAEHAPRIIGEVSFHKGLWDVAFSQEAELRPSDEYSPAQRITERVEAAGVNWEAALAAALRREFVLACLKEAYHRDISRTWTHLAETADCGLRIALDKLGGSDLDVVLLGRLGSRELLLPSDWDLFFLVENSAEHARAERIGEDFVRLSRRLSAASGYFPVDTRLRPEGSAGLVVRTLAGLDSYAASEMETWERLALTRGRSLRGLAWCSDVLDRAAFGSWGPAQEAQVLHMRRRIQLERTHPWELHRDLKLGEGFLLDIEWLAAILRLRRRGSQLPLGQTCDMLATLEAAGCLTSREAERLSAAFRLFSRMRDIMFLLNLDSDSILPENPDKLNRIASSLGMASGNDVLLSVQEHREYVARTFQEVIVRG